MTSCFFYRSNAGDSSRSPKTKPAPVVDASPPSSPDVGSASPNPADYGADRGPIRRAQRPHNNNSGSNANNSGSNANNHNNSRPRVNVRWESTLPRHTTDPAMDVLRERTAAMNLGGSRGEFQFLIFVWAIRLTAACFFNRTPRSQKRESDDSDESGVQGQRGELVPKIPYARVDSVPLVYFRTPPSHCATYPNTRLITNTQSPPNH